MKQFIALLTVAICWFIAGAAIAQQQPDAKRTQPKPSYRYWTTNWEFEDVDVGNIVDRLDGIGVELPVRADGKVTVRFQVSVPLNALRTGTAYKINGHVSSPKLVVGQLSLERFDSDVILAGGVLSLSKTQGYVVDRTNLDSGSFRGEVRATVIAEDNEPKPLTINVAVDSLPISPIANLFLSDLVAANKTTKDASGANTSSPSGSATGKMIFAGNIRTISDVTTYRTTGNLRVDELRYADLPPLSVRSGDFKLTDGSLSASSLSVRSQDGSNIALVGSIEASLADDRKFEFALQGNDVPTDAFSKLLDGKVDLNLRGGGFLGETIEAGKWSVQGEIASPSLSIAGQPTGLIEHRIELSDRRVSINPISSQPSGEVNLHSVNAEYEISASQIEVSDLSADLYGGSMTGSAKIARTDSSTHVIDLKWDEIAPRIDRSLVRYFIGSSVDLVPGIGSGLETTAISLATSGAIDWQVPANKLDQPSAHVGNLDVSVDSISIGRSKVGSLAVRLATDQSTIDLQGEGNLFGGKISVTSDAAVAGATNWQNVASELVAATIQMRGVDLGRMMPMVRPKDPRRYEGRVDLVYDNSIQKLDASVVNFSISDRIISRRLSLEAAIVDGVLEIDQLGGRYAGGQLSGVGQINLTGDRNTRVQLRLLDVMAGRGLSPITDTIASVYDGRVGGVVTILQTGRSVSMSGLLTSRQSKVVGLPLGELSTPISVSVGPNLKRWSVSFASIRGNSHGGVLVGDLSLRSSGGGVGFDMDGKFGARHVDFGEALGDAAMTSSFAHGDLSGGLTIGGTMIRGLNDLRGRFAADLETGTGAAIPGLTEASRFLAGLNLANTRLTDGSIEGTIGNGAIQIDELIAKSEQILVVAEGRIGMRDMRMDVGAVISTGQFTTTAEIGPRLIQRFAINSVLPGVTLLEIGRFISNRTIFVSVNGPVSHPIVRLKPVETAQAALRRLAVEQIIPLITGGVVGDSLYD